MTAQFLVSTTDYMAVTFRRKEKKEQVWERVWRYRKKISSVFDTETRISYRLLDVEIRRDMWARVIHLKVIGFMSDS